MSLTALNTVFGVLKGGAGSGHFGHEGRPGEVGGSQPGSGGQPQGVETRSLEIGGASINPMDLSSTLSLKATSDGHEIAVGLPENVLAKIVSPSQWREDTPGVTAALQGMQDALNDLDPETKSWVKEHVYIGCTNQRLYGQAVTATSNLALTDDAVILLETSEPPTAPFERSILVENAGKDAPWTVGTFLANQTYAKAGFERKGRKDAQAARDEARDEAIRVMYKAILTHEIGHVVDAKTQHSASDKIARRIFDLSVKAGHDSFSPEDNEWRMNYIEKTLGGYARRGGPKEAFAELYAMKKLLGKLPKDFEDFSSVLKSELPPDLIEWSKIVPKDVIILGPPKKLKKADTMPIGPYPDFAACVAAQIEKGHSEDSAKRICGAIEANMHKMTVVEKSNERKYTLGIVYEPDEIDTQDEFAKAEDIEAAAWDYMARLQYLAKTGVSLVSSALEGSNAKIELTPELEEIVMEVSKSSALDDQHLQIDGHLGVVVESYIAPADFQIENQAVKKGSWLLGVVWSDEMFNKIKKGERTGFSMFGRARRVEYRAGEN